MHAWDVSPEQAIAIQERLQREVIHQAHHLASQGEIADNYAVD